MSRELKLFGGWEQTPATVWSVAPDVGGKRVVIITYTVNRKPFSSELNTKQPFTEGTIFLLRYDPTNPKRNELIVRQHIRQALLWVGLLMVLVMSFVVTLIIRWELQ